MIKLTTDSRGVRMSLKVVPGASRDRIVGILGDALKIAVSKPPADGAANKAVLKLLAEALDVPEPMIQLLRGHANPRKEVLIVGISADELLKRLEKLLP